MTSFFSDYIFLKPIVANFTVVSKGVISEILRSFSEVESDRLGSKHTKLPSHQTLCCRYYSYNERRSFCVLCSVPRSGADLQTERETSNYRELGTEIQALFSLGVGRRPLPTLLLQLCTTYLFICETWWNTGHSISAICCKCGAPVEFDNGMQKGMINCLVSGNSSSHAPQRKYG
jgi:hypothetical protein